LPSAARRFGSTASPRKRSVRWRLVRGTQRIPSARPRIFSINVASASPAYQPARHGGKRQIVINETEAEIVRYIFRRYGELGCVRLLQEDLNRMGIVRSTASRHAVSNQTVGRFRAEPSTRCSRIRSTSGRSVTRISTIRVSTKRSWIETYGSTRSSSAANGLFATRRSQPGGSESTHRTIVRRAR
jgi:hypothetical protein